MHDEQEKILTFLLQTLCIRGSNVPLPKKNKVYLKTVQVPNIGIYTCKFHIIQYKTVYSF